MQLTRSTPTTAPMPTSAGLLHTVFGPELRGIGAIDGGRPTAADRLELRFIAGRDALAARALLRGAIDGVQLLVRTADGQTVGEGDAARVSAGDAAGLLARVPGVLDVDVRSSPEPCLVVWARSPEVNAHLAPLVRDEVAGLRVVWQTRA